MPTADNYKSAGPGLHCAEGGTEASAGPELLTFFTHRASAVGSVRCKMGHSEPWGNQRRGRERGREGGGGEVGGAGPCGRRCSMEGLLFFFFFFYWHSLVSRSPIRGRWELFDKSEWKASEREIPFVLPVWLSALTLSAFIRRGNAARRSPLVHKDGPLFEAGSSLGSFLNLSLDCRSLSPVNCFNHWLVMVF